MSRILGLAALGGRIGPSTCISFWPLSFVSMDITSHFCLYLCRILLASVSLGILPISSHEPSFSSMVVTISLYSCSSSASWNICCSSGSASGPLTSIRLHSTSSLWLDLSMGSWNIFSAGSTGALEQASTALMNLLFPGQYLITKGYSSRSCRSFSPLGVKSCISLPM